MMVNTKKMHSNYVNDLRKQIKQCKENVELNKINIVKSTKKLVDFQCLIAETLKIKYVDILSIKSKQKLDGIFKSKLAKLYSSSQELRYVKLLCNIIFKAKAENRTYEQTIIELKSKIINYSQYKFIISNFNEMISDKIITEGYVLKLGHRLGEIRIIKKKRSNKKPIDWNASNKAKEAIIAKGDIPYNKTTAPNGVEWLVYFTDLYGYYWYWSKYLCTCTNRDSYSFKPTAGDYGNIKKLNQYRKHNPLVVHKYKT
jgi:hypothetical protein